MVRGTQDADWVERNGARGKRKLRDSHWRSIVATWQGRRELSNRPRFRRAAGRWFVGSNKPAGEVYWVDKSSGIAGNTSIIAHLWTQNSGDTGPVHSKPDSRHWTGFGVQGTHNGFCPHRSGGKNPKWRNPSSPKRTPYTGCSSQGRPMLVWCFSCMRLSKIQR